MVGWKSTFFELTSCCSCTLSISNGRTCFFFPASWIDKNNKLCSLTRAWKRSRSIYQNSNMAPRLSGQNCKFWKFFVPRDLDTKKTTLNIEVRPESLGAMLEYWYNVAYFFLIIPIAVSWTLPAEACWQGNFNWHNSILRSSSGNRFFRKGLHLLAC